MAAHSRDAISGMAVHSRERISGMAAHRRELISGMATTYLDQCDSEAGAVGKVDEAVLWQRLVGEEAWRGAAYTREAIGGMTHA